MRSKLYKPASQRWSLQLGGSDQGFPKKAPAGNDAEAKARDSNDGDRAREVRIPAGAAERFAPPEEPRACQFTAERSDCD